MRSVLTYSTAQSFAKYTPVYRAGESNLQDFLMITEFDSKRTTRVDGLLKQLIECLLFYWLNEEAGSWQEQQYITQTDNIK